MKTSAGNLFGRENRPRRDDRLSKLAHHWREKYSAVIIPLDADNKPLVTDWQSSTYHLTDDQIDDVCTRQECVALGVRNDSIIDVDLDRPEAVELADLFLTATLVTGRESRPRSHYLYSRGDELPGFTEYAGASPAWHPRMMICELRSGAAHYTILPGGAHKSGELTHAEKTTAGKPLPPRKAPDDLARRVSHLVACCVIAKHWREGVRDKMTTALIRVLHDRQYDADHIERIISAVATIANDEERRAREAKVQRLCEQLALGSERKINGLPTLIDHVGDDGELLRKCLTDGSDEWQEPTDLAEGDAVPEVPKDAVPSVLYNRAADIAERVCAPVEAGLFPSMCETAYTVGSAVRVALKTHSGDQDDAFTQPLIFFSYVAMPSGTGKTPAQNQATQYLTANHRKAAADFKEQYGIWKDQEARRRNGEQIDAEARVQRPVPEIHKINDATIEAIIKEHDNNPRGMMVSCDELSLMILNAGKYTGGRSTDEAIWCSMYDGGEINKVRAGDNASFYRASSCVQIYGGIQPGILPTLLTADNKLLGLAARFNLCAIPDLPPIKMVDKPARADFKKRYTSRLEKLRELFAPFDDRDDGVYLFTLDKEAQRLFNDEELRIRQQVRVTDEPYRTHLGKYPGLLGRIALLWWLCKCDLSKVKEVDNSRMLDHSAIEKIDAETMSEAIMFLDYLSQHARKIYRITDMQRGEVEGRALAKLLTDDHARDGKLPEYITAGQVLARHRSDLNSTEAIASGALWLESRNWCRWHPNFKVPGTRGRPSDRIMINPQLMQLLAE